MKGKALRRAIEADPLRVGAEIPLIVDTTELVTPDKAKELLQKNSRNRPINWRKVEEYAELMRAGQWKLHGQGIILDANGNVLTGQKRLWAVIKSGCNIYMRISRGNPSDTAALIDRGAPQSARDLASRATGRKHSPIEASIARAVAVLRGTVRPSTDEITSVIEDHAGKLSTILALTRGGVKTKAALMVLAAMLERDGLDLRTAILRLPVLADKLEAALSPRTASECWGRGAAFSLAMAQAKRIVFET